MGPPTGRPSALPKGPLLPRDQGALLGRSELAEHEASQRRADELDVELSVSLSDDADSADDVAMPPSHSRASVAPLGAPPRNAGIDALSFDDGPESYDYPAQSDKLDRAGGLTSRRITDFSGQVPSTGHLISHAAEPAFAEIRNLLSSIVANAAFGRMVVAELEPLLGRLADAARGLLPPDEFERVLAGVPHAVDAHRELTITFAELDGVSKKLIDTVGGLEKTVAARSSYVQAIGETIDAATVAAHHFTKLIGGVRWEALPEVVARSPAPAWMGLVVSIALQELAARIGPSNQDGIDGRIEAHGASVVIVLGSPRLGEVECQDIVGDLGFLLNGVSLLGVTADGPTVRLKL